MADLNESLAGRRSKRSTAGNRMEAALAELDLDELAKDPEDDVDFANDNDEEDIFGSDFESTDEDEAMQNDAGDKAVEDEEKRARRAARSRIDRATATAHARQKVTFNPEAGPSSPKASASAKRPQRRVSLGLATNAETGEVIVHGKRQSRRRHTILNTSATVRRVKRAEEKKASVPKKTKSEERVITQDELIARALDTEEGNTVEHRDYLKLEEEKRKRARVVRAAIEGPLLKWVSKGEEVKILLDAPTPNIPMSPYGYNPSDPHSTAASYPGDPSAHHNGVNRYEPARGSFPPSPPQIERTEKMTRNYIVHELSQSESAQRPRWKDTMDAMFGDHVAWDDVKVFVGKSRPLSRPKKICALTGLPAPYLDPRTGVPFANIQAYDTLTKILNHEFIWSDGLGCYVSREGRQQPFKSSAARGSSTSVLNDAMDLS
ncbi:hypothetical protein PLICRDRAFT_88667 [Plicaturopsis crispa FD-325 SS-3]|nr:hypothetical protein PLICRDRAFT_88667 [Plicaturopsis crispa FD-325 SS-3]